MSARKSNFELMRIFLMLMVVAGHLTINSGKLGSLGTADYYVANICRSFCMFSVNAFVLLSGYFGVKLNVRKLIHLTLKVAFYTYFFFILSLLLGIHQLDLMKDIQLLIPIITKKYWFITIYFVLCIFSPYLNRLLEMLSEKELKHLLILGFVVFYLIATFCFAINADQIATDAGYGFLNFIYLYCLGFYIRHYYKDAHSAHYYFVLYIACSVILFIANHFMTSVLGFYFNSFISYNTVFVLAGAVSLFMCFKNLNIKTNNFLNHCASRSFFVFIIHSAPYFAHYIFVDYLKLNSYSGLHLAVVFIVLPFAVYAVCWLIDYVTDFLMKPIYHLINKLPLSR